jgi:hypothetical protein
MIEESWDDEDTPKPFEQVCLVFREINISSIFVFVQQTTIQKLGIGRGKSPFPSSNNGKNL